MLPPYLITEAQVEEMRRHTRAFAERLGVVGLLNVQYAIKNGVVYVLEVNPRGSRTVPFVSKTTGVPLASLAAAIMAGKTLDELGLHDDVLQPYVAVKEAVFPFSKLQGVDLILGPEMRSTGEVMGIADSFGMAFAKAQISADGALPARRARSSSRSTTTTRRTSCRSPGGSTRSASGSSRPRARRAIFAPAAFPPSGCSRCTRAGPTPSTSWSRARSSC